ncbi:MAG: F0F1 ATP synthase subunit B, partial [Syntrophomonadaceae bacterium]|nr:F0F1 ATP synthase subunit B [Syntrophomonadaceae bacterium]
LSMVLVLGLATSCFGSEEGVPPFPDYYKIGWTAVNFFILFAILYKFGYTPVLNMMEQRTTTIESSLRHAEELRAEVEQMRREAQNNLSESRKEAQDIVARATKIAEESKNEIIAKAQADARLEKEKALAEIQAEKEQALTELRDTAASLAIMAAEKVLGRALTDADHQGMVKEFVKEAGDLLC